ncbi:MAG TPA: TMEM43 family protein [bacterium]|nr:TMEM43 family protein [bacterium]HPQ67112.1 TMEM43 family protein [bacterium]
MADQFTEVTRTGYGSNIVASFKGMAFGVLLFLASFVVLWISEGRTNWGSVARESVPTDAGSPPSAGEGTFISISGPLTTEALTGDPEFLRPGPYVSLQRVVEMYAWKEESQSRTEKKIGGGSETTTTYTYSREWTENPADSSDFKHPEGHFNPAPAVESRSFLAPSAKIGAYDIVPGEIVLPGGSSLSLGDELLVPRPETAAVAWTVSEESATPPVSPSPAAVPSPSPALSGQGPRFDGRYVYLGTGSGSAPRVGDLRVSFLALPSGTGVTAFGAVRGTGIGPWYRNGEERFFRALAGDRVQALSQLTTEYRVTTWILRAVGFLCMWIGLCMVVAPISAILDVLPFLGGLTRGVLSLVLLLVSLVLSFLVVIVAKIFHNPVALVVLLLAAGAGAVILIRRARRRAAPAPAPGG